jgi:hypothetical protein
MKSEPLPTSDEIARSLRQVEQLRELCLSLSRAGGGPDWVHPALLRDGKRVPLFPMGTAPDEE